MNRIVCFFARRSHLVLLTVVLVIGCIVSPVFITWTNMTNIIVQIPYYALMAFAMTIAIISKGIDLSIGSNMALSCCVAGYFLAQGKILIGVVAAVMVGIAIGFINGLLIAKLQLPPFIATYCMDWITKGIAYVMMMGSIFFPFPDAFRAISVGKTFGISNIVLSMILVTVLIYFLMNKTVFGRNVYVIGSNCTASKLSGVQTDKIICLVYIVSGILAAIAGLLMIARLDAADANYAEGWGIKLIAATLIGGTPMKGGEGSVQRTLVGVIIINVIYNILNLVGMSSLWQQFVVGCIILLSIFINMLSDFALRHYDRRA